MPAVIAMAPLSSQPAASHISNDLFKSSDVMVLRVPGCKKPLYLRETDPKSSVRRRNFRPA
jgi:hypothetical protein